MTTVSGAGDPGQPGNATHPTSHSYNTFSRSFGLPENVNGDDMAAQYADGVLKVILPKKNPEEKISKQIAVK